MALATATLLTVADTSSAQFRRRAWNGWDGGYGWRGGYWGGYGYSSPWYGGYGYYSPRSYGIYTPYGSVSFGSSYYGPYYSSYSYPYYSGYYSYPSYSGWSYSAPAYSYAYPSDNYVYSSDSMVYPTESYVMDSDSMYISTDGSTIDSPNSRAFISLTVPDSSAEVWFDDHKTSQMGSFRRYHTPPLDAGGTYSVRVHWRENGKDMDQVKSVTVHPGDRLNVDIRPGTTYTSETVPPAPLPAEKNDVNNNNNKSDTNKYDINK
jgi:uncharacterized protein (TIGR03000 family)